MIRSWRWIGCWVLLLAVSGCHQPTGMPESASAETKAVQTVAAAEATPSSVDWSKAEDCRGKLALLERGLEKGDLSDLDGTPFLLIGDGPVNADRRWLRASGRIGPGSDAASSSPEVRCILRIGPAIDRRSDHRVLGREQVRSRYQSGTRSEKNPAYEVAKARLRKAEKAAKPGKSSIIKVGDPLIDLVGTLVGGALTGLGQWGSGDQLEEALDVLMATPPSIEHPKYQSYHFERARVRASRQATLPVILTDRWLQRSWQVSLKRREVQELSVIDGLDQQDADYARHREESLTESGLRQWLAESPSLPLADMVAGLLDRSSSAPTDRVAFDDPVDAPTETGALDDTFMDAAALPPAGWLAQESAATGGSSPEHGVDASRITLVGNDERAEGIYVTSHFILASSDVIDGRGLIDIEDRPGHVTLGLVAAVDHGLGLALIHAPVSGEPITVSDVDGPIPENTTLGSASSSIFAARKHPASKPGKSAPLVIDDELVGFRTSSGPDIERDAIQAFLDRHRHLFATES